jgi:hypothetical protein
MDDRRMDQSREFDQRERERALTGADARALTSADAQAFMLSHPSAARVAGLLALEIPPTHERECARAQSRESENTQTWRCPVSLASAMIFAILLALGLHSASRSGSLAAPASVSPERFEARSEESAMRKNPKSFAVAAAAALSVSFTATAQDAVQWRVEDGGNGHWYRVQLHGSTLDWFAAKFASEELGGHLVTITSVAEDQFVRAVVRIPAAFNWFAGPWMGGYQDIEAPNYLEPSLGWRWVTDEPWFDGWTGSEPNGGTLENFLHMAGTAPEFNNLNWNDLGFDSATQPVSFLIEWSADCNSDGLVDFGQIRAGELDDANGNNIPDCCEGTLTTWGDNSQGQSNPPLLGSQIISISAGYDHSACLLSNGSVRVWGYNAFGQCDVPTNLGAITALATGDRFVLALRSNGSIRAWGFNGSGQCNVPADIGQAQGIAAGGNHSMAKLVDGTLRCWGNNDHGQCSVPRSLGAVDAFDGGVYHSIAIAAVGEVRCWGLNDYGQCTPPNELPAPVSVSGGDRHSVALLESGTVRCWGQNNYGQCSPPADLSRLVAISASDRYTLGLTTSGRVVRWGQAQGQLPGTEAVYTMIAAGAYHGMAVLAQEECLSNCPADITGNGNVDAADLAAVLSAWGGAPSGKENADINGDGSIDAADLAGVLSAWGPCP